VEVCLDPQKHGLKRNENEIHREILIPVQKKCRTGSRGFCERMKETLA
jgi:hypothetical protein